MTSENFIIENLRKLIKKYPEIDIRYQNDEHNNAHFIQVGPNDLFQTDEFWNDAERMDIEFMSLFPLENMAFYSVDDTCPIEHVTWRYRSPKLHIAAHQIKIGAEWAQLLTKQYEQFLSPDCFVDIDNFRAVYNATANVVTKLHHNTLDKLVNNSDVVQNHTNIIVDANIHYRPEYMIGGENNYALAA